ncbi:hypothetical protein CDL12_28917 [Handroanthus impetiginosus]|uniref:Uncharacterized protein n=1 Tax=Handroanthus impetiginosus TaxID=429701 RepID=A0A2G9FZY1_9LAMI|nr:hypothetical protein CDL12_28917 [Handroanthus impetiginosus]
MANNYVNDVASTPARPAHFKVYKWLESDAKFGNWMSSDDLRTAADRRSSFMSNFRPARVTDSSLSHRQLFLNSYTFSREGDHTMVKCLAKVKDKLAAEKRERSSGRGGEKKITESIFLRIMLSCVVKLDVDD